MAASGKNLDYVFDRSGNMERPRSVFRSYISNAPGAEFPPESGRYHLYVQYACPWAQRTLIVRKLKDLENIISFSAVHWHLELDKGWRFPKSDESVKEIEFVPDPLHDGTKYLRELYLKTSPDYAGRNTVPVLWDKKTDRIVNNESSEIIRMLNSAFNDLLPPEAAAIDIYPKSLQSQIDSTHEWMYSNINDGVYKAGTARSQEAYESAVRAVFENLDRAEAHLSTSPGPYYFGANITEVDIRLYVTIIRFDPVYVQHFKCNIRDIRSGYPAIHRWLRNLYWNHPAFQSTTNFENIKKHYMVSHTMINPWGIVAQGPHPNILREGEEVNTVSKAAK